MKVVAYNIAEKFPNVTTRKTPRKSSASNGKVERFHQSVQGLVRTWRPLLEEKLKIKITPEHVLTPCIIRHASWTLRMMHRKADGLTPREK